jgi:hypothetical protein
VKDFHKLKQARNILIAVCAASAVVTVISSPGSASAASSSGLLYNYEFTHTTGTGTVVNSAPGGPKVSLRLRGTWSHTKAGVKFSGNTSGNESVAYGEPSGGYTINEPATAAIGFGVRIQYEGPATGKCFKGTPNVTQVGSYLSKPVPTQLKLQLSDCHTSSTAARVECRFAGSETTASTDLPVTSTLPLVGGNVYNISCVKSPDKNGKTTITLDVTPVTTGRATVNKFTAHATGYLRTNQYISAANKYPLPSAADNTNQFDGIMTRAVYCAGSSAQVAKCLAAYLPVK